jgi:uncharacterized protein YoxC
MQTAIQIVLIVSVASLTIIFVTVGVWVILILREIRKILDNVEDVSEDVGQTTEMVKEKVKQGLSTVTILTALGQLWSRRKDVGDFIQDIKGNSEEESFSITDNGEENQDPEPEKKEKKHKRRFFRKK